jgi:T5orf172 domain
MTKQTQPSQPAYYAMLIRRPEHPHVIDEVAYPRFATRGRTFVYVLPCRDEDILKVGFSRDPLERMRTLHPRFFEFFDLERALLIETDQLREARRIERLFITTFVDHQAPAPLVVPRAAAGYTEWYRGIHPMVTALARSECAASALTLQAPLSAWLRDRFEQWSDRLFDWSAQMLELIEYERFNVPMEEKTQRGEKALSHVLDTYAALGVDVQPRVPRAVWSWYQNRGALVFGESVLKR